jgi:hypothetical protein
MADDDPMLEVGRAIRPYLADLLADPDAAAAADAHFAALLAEAREGRPVDVAILARLKADPELHRWAAAFLQHGAPPEVVAEPERGPGEAPPGDVGATPSRDVFACPEGDYVWWRRAVGLAVPVCPTHGLPLERRD